jgi:hypothetical protein
MWPGGRGGASGAGARRAGGRPVGSAGGGREGSWPQMLIWRRCQEWQRVWRRPPLAGVRMRMRLSAYSSQGFD